MHELTRLVTDNPEAAKKKIRAVFAEAGYDYFTAAARFECHHYLLRRHARTLGITALLSRDRKRAIRRGERPDDNGRPAKPVPSASTIVKAYTRNGYNVAKTAEALGVTQPTLRKWCRDLKLDLKGSEPKVA